MKLNGQALLLKLFSLPAIPFDFPTSSTSYSVATLFRAMNEVNPGQVIEAILSELEPLLQEATPFLEYNGTESLTKQFVDIVDKDGESVRRGNQILRSLVSLHGLIGLLSDTYQSTVFTHVKNVQPVIEALMSETGQRVIAKIGLLHR